MKKHFVVKASINPTYRSQEYNGDTEFNELAKSILPLVTSWLSRDFKTSLCVTGTPAHPDYTNQYIVQILHSSDGMKRISFYGVIDDGQGSKKLAGTYNNTIAFEYDSVEDLVPYFPDEVIDKIKNYDEAFLVKRSKSAKPKGKGKPCNYTFYICDNKSAASRGTEMDTFYEETKTFNSDWEAFAYGACLTWGYSSIEELVEANGEIDFKDMVDDQDTGAGFPIVYAIKSKGRFIYKAYFYDDIIADRDAIENGDF